ncbi:MAG TPA: glycosyl hydrolase family 65 protein [Candidatus Dormibacteraeota bacterium]
MIHADCFRQEPWAIREVRLDHELLGQTESLFALSNGHVGWRANLDEGEPHAISGSYLNAFYEEIPLPSAETAFGYPEAGQAIVNVTDGKIVRMLVDDEPFDTRYGNLISHERVLDLKAGSLHREVQWESPAHRRIRMRSTRIVSLVHRAVAAILYEVEPVDGAANFVLQSELVANEPPDGIARDDPRSGSIFEAPLESELFHHDRAKAVLIHSTQRSKLRMAAAMDHVIAAPRGYQLQSESMEDRARVSITARLRPGQKLRVAKFVAYGWSGTRSAPALQSQVDGALAAAVSLGWRGLAAAQRKLLSEFWNGADVEIKGDAEIQFAIRFALFHVLQSAARSEQRAIPAKGLTGPGYNGHTFWDTETYVLPVLTYTAPQTVADVLRWRHQTLDLAKGRAALLGFKGAAFPWRTIRGEECSGYWPASTAAFHINADIADAVLRYISATNDRAFEEKVGVELLVETARLWMSLGHNDGHGRFRIDGVTGPDEYSALADNNLYTNLMAQRNLRGAAAAVARNPDSAKRLKVRRSEVESWRKAAERILIPYDEALGVHEQASEFTKHEHWDFGKTTPEQYPLFLHFHYFDLYRKQVVKQADLVLAMFLRGDAFTHEEKARNFTYYEAMTVRDSSLSASMQAIIAAEIGHIELAYDYVGEAALIDLHDLEHNVRDGVHMGSLAGAWLAVVAGLGGMRHHQEVLSFAPRLPQAIRSLTFRMTFMGRLLRLTVGSGRVKYSLMRGGALSFDHYGKGVRLSSRGSVTRAIPKVVAALGIPIQPPGREPVHRSALEKPRELRPRPVHSN